MGEGKKAYKSFGCTQWAGMYTLKDVMPGLVHLGNPFRRRQSPGQKDDSFSPFLSHDVDDLLGELLPSML